MIIDVNTSLGQWPFQRFGLNSARALVKHLRAAGITKAFVSSIEAVLYPDPDPCNSELFKAVKPHPLLIPVPVVNPTLTNWRSALAMQGLKAAKIIPNYHGYQLTDPAVAHLMQALTDLHIPLMIQMRVDDERNQSPLMKVPGVSSEAVIHLANAFSRVRIICLCAYRGEAALLVQKTRNAHVDIAFIETCRTMPTILKRIPQSRILFGSHTPFLYTEPAVMKLDTIRRTSRAWQAAAHRNAERLFNRSI